MPISPPAAAKGDGDGKDDAPGLRSRMGESKGKGKGKQRAVDTDTLETSSSEETTSGSDTSCVDDGHSSAWNRRMRQTDSDWSAYNDTDTCSSDSAADASGGRF